MGYIAIVDYGAGNLMSVHNSLDYLGYANQIADTSEIIQNAAAVILPGVIRRIETGFKLPQIGWNALHIAHPNALTADLQEGDYVYFVHSYAAVPEYWKDLACWTDYGTKVPAMVARGNVYGCQFHPEKSGDTGLSILKNFARLTEEKP